jgi:hypothetical protein
MTRRGLLIPALIALTAALSTTAWFLHRSSQPVRLSLHFHPFVGPEPLVLNELRYPNPGGDGRFKVRDFQLFLSNIRLVDAAGAWAETDSYHLARFDVAGDGYVIVLPNVPRRDYDRIELGIGVDAAANRSIEARGDLDPNGRMAWSWDVGYKFVLFEGALELGDTQYPLVYHVGFDENYQLVSADLEPGLLKGRDPRLDFRVDVGRLFEGSSTVDMAALPNVKFDRTDAALLARNYAGMVSRMASGRID